MEFNESEYWSQEEENIKDFLRIQAELKEEKLRETPEERLKRLKYEDYLGWYAEWESK